MKIAETGSSAQAPSPMLYYSSIRKGHYYCLLPYFIMQRHVTDDVMSKQNEF